MSILINEVDSDQRGLDTGEFVELTGAPGAALDGYSLVFFNGHDNRAYLVLDLAGKRFDAAGFFVAGNAAVLAGRAAEASAAFADNTLQNGADAVALYRSAGTVRVGMAATVEGLVDALAYGTSDPEDSDLLAALGLSVQHDENANGAGVAEAVQRAPDGSNRFVAAAPSPGAPNLAGSDDIPPAVARSMPRHDAAGVALDTDVVLTFDEIVRKGAGRITVHRAADDAAVAVVEVASPAVGVAGSQARIDLPADLAPDTAYYVLIDGGAFLDQAGNPFAGFARPDDFRFTTARPDRIDGTPGDDILVGDAGNDMIGGQDGDDVLRGLGGDDSLMGGRHRDTLLGGEGDDTLDGGAGNDTLVGGPGADRLVGGSGTDTADYFGAAAGVTADLAAPATNAGEAEGDRYSSIEWLRGSAQGDRLGGTDAGNRIWGMTGADSIDAAGGRDTVHGGAGDDLAAGGGGDDRLEGEAGDDTLDGGADDDTLLGQEGGDFLLGGAGDDALWGMSGADRLRGGDGNDVLGGGTGADALEGGAGDDTLAGGAGADTLAGRTGDDLFHGPAAMLDGDRIADFAAGDRLRIHQASLGNRQIRVTEARDTTVLRLDTDSDGRFETTVTLDGTALGDVSAQPDRDFTDIVLTPASPGNDAPVNRNVPAAITVLDGADAHLSRLRVWDADARDGTLAVALAADGGATVSLGSTDGLSFLLGDGSADRVMVFAGTTAAINRALAEGVSLSGVTADGGGRTLLMASHDGRAFDIDAIGITAREIGAGDRIFDIQGAGRTASPPGGATVRDVPGIVTAVAPNGFYMQDPIGDGREDTSDGLFVFSNAAVSVGDLVRVSGSVSEYFGLSQIAGNPAVATLGPGGDVASTLVGAGGRRPPTEIIDNDGATDYQPGRDGLDFWESLEGMLIRIEDARAVGYTSRFGEIWAVGDGGTQATGYNAARGVTVLRDGGDDTRFEDDDFNPERIEIDDTLFPGATPPVEVGYGLGSLAGVVGYSFNNYQILPTEALAPTEIEVGREVTRLAAGPTAMTVASFNVENADPADGPEHFAQLARTIVENLRSPDVIGVQEMQDDSGPLHDGTVTSARSAAALIAAIREAGGPDDYAWFDIAPEDGRDGGEPGGNIRVGYLYRASRVALDESSPWTGRVTDPDPSDGDAFADSRKPLSASFTFLPTGDRVHLVNNHLTSRGGSDPLWGEKQPPATNEAVREAQAAILNAHVDRILEADPDARIVVLGDLNTFQFSSTLDILTGGDGDGVIEEGEARVLWNLADGMPETERFSYNFDGNAQILDHILVSRSLHDRVAGAEYLHVNSGLMDQSSDHDPVIVRFAFGAPAGDEWVPLPAARRRLAPPPPSPTRIPRPRSCWRPWRRSSPALPRRTAARPGSP